MLRVGFEPTQNLSSGIVEWSCIAVISITQRCHESSWGSPFFLWCDLICDVMLQFLVNHSFKTCTLWSLNYWNAELFEYHQELFSTVFDLLGFTSSFMCSTPLKKWWSDFCCEDGKLRNESLLLHVPHPLSF